MTHLEVWPIYDDSGEWEVLEMPEGNTVLIGTQADCEAELQAVQDAA